MSIFSRKDVGLEDLVRNYYEHLRKIGGSALYDPKIVTKVLDNLFYRLSFDQNLDEGRDVARAILNFNPNLLCLTKEQMAQGLRILSIEVDGFNLEQGIDALFGIAKIHYTGEAVVLATEAYNQRAALAASHSVLKKPQEHQGLIAYPQERLEELKRRLLGNNNFGLIYIALENSKKRGVLELHPHQHNGREYMLTNQIIGTEEDIVRYARLLEDLRK